MFMIFIFIDMKLVSHGEFGCAPSQHFALILLSISFMLFLLDRVQ